MTSFFGIRDHTRDDYCRGLKEIGVNARMAERGREEEKNPPNTASLGLIDVEESPIRWINLYKYGLLMASSVAYGAIFGIPDDRITAELSGASLHAVPVRRFPVFGRVVDLYWKGDARLGGIIDRMNENRSLKKNMIENGRVMMATVNVDFGGWTSAPPNAKVPTRGSWEFYETFANQLIDAPLQNS